MCLYTDSKILLYLFNCGRSAIAILYYHSYSFILGYHTNDYFSLSSLAFGGERMDSRNSIGIRKIIE